MAARASARLRRGLVAGLERRGAPTQPAVRDAFLAVARELGRLPWRAFAHSLELARKLTAFA